MLAMEWFGTTSLNYLESRPVVLYVTRTIQKEMSDVFRNK